MIDFFTFYLPFVPPTKAVLQLPFYAERGRNTIAAASNPSAAKCDQGSRSIMPIRLLPATA